MQGTRLADGWNEGIPPAGSYFKSARGVWMATTPNGLLGDLGNHEVVEHEDGTISVTPSILVTTHRDEVQWHGFLERGVWRQV